MIDAYSDWDAAYLLGSLSSAERREFEAHLGRCKDCSASVAELAVLPGLLSRVSANDAERDIDQSPLPVSLLPRLIAATRRKRRRDRSLVAGLVAAAAAVAVAATLLVPQLLPADTGARAVEVTLSQVVASPLDAEVRLVSHEWGTSIDMECRYAAGSRNYDSGASYGMYVTDTAGNSAQLSTWSAKPGSTVHLTGTTSVPLADIRAVDIRTLASGEVLLSGSP